MGIELRAACMPSEHTSDRATPPGLPNFCGTYRIKGMLNHDKMIHEWGCFTAWWYAKNLLLKDLAFGVVPSSHQRSDLSNTILSIFSSWDQKIWAGIPIPDSLAEEATFPRSPTTIHTVNRFSIFYPTHQIDTDFDHLTFAFHFTYRSVVARGPSDVSISFNKCSCFAFIDSWRKLSASWTESSRFQCSVCDFLGGASAMTHIDCACLILWQTATYRLVPQVIQQRHAMQCHATPCHVMSCHVSILRHPHCWVLCTGLPEVEYACETTATGRRQPNHIHSDRFFFPCKYFAPGWTRTRTEEVCSLVVKYS